MIKKEEEIKRLREENIIIRAKNINQSQINIKTKERDLKALELEIADLQDTLDKKSDEKSKQRKRLEEFSNFQREMSHDFDIEGEETNG